MAKIGAAELIASVSDPDTFRTWDTLLPDPEVDDDYRERLAAARAKSGVDESIITGEALVNGARTCIVVGEFSFLGGTIGRVSSERIVRAFERAREQGLPIFASPTSGGTRVQEGTLAFLHLLKISRAVAAFRSSGLAYVVHLRHPTTGGPLVSWGSLGHVTFAQPGALVGMLGPRVGEVLTGSALPADTQRADNLTRIGVIDAVVDLPDLRGRVQAALNIINPPPVTTSSTPLPTDAHDGVERAWAAVQATDNPNRPGLQQVLDYRAKSFIPLWATATSISGNVVVGLADFGGFRCVVVGQDRGKSPAQVTTIAGLNATRRAVDLAQKLDLPVVTFIDTPGVEISRAAEEGGIAGGIAHTVETLVQARVPVVSVILGAGTGVSALTLLPGDRTVCAGRGWLAPLPLAGASEILFQDPQHAPELAAKQGIRPRDLRSAGLVDTIVAEHPDAAAEPEAFSHRITTAIHHHLIELVAMPETQRLRTRWQRFRAMM